MGSKTNIEWVKNADGTAGSTWNPVVGCDKVSPGCKNCYAETMSKRLKAMALANIRNGVNPGRKRHYLNVINERGHWNGNIEFVDDALFDPLRQKKPTVYFVNSMSDLFHENVKDTWIDRAFAVMALCPQHVFQILTKRPERMLEYLTAPSVRYPDSTEPRPEISYQLGNLTDVTNTASIRQTSDAQNRMCNGGWPLPNVWLGVSVEDQKTADERIPLLLQTPAAIRWLSMEPLLSEVNFRWTPYAHQATNETYRQYLERMGSIDQYESLRKIDWVVVGGESGPNARPSHPDWFRSIRDQCVAAGVPFFFKQHGEWAGQDQVSMAIARKAGDVRNILRDGSEYKEGWIRSNDLACMLKVGKRNAGRMLDRREWNEMPV